MSNIEYKKEEIAKKYNISPIVLELMAGRGVTSEEKLKQYLNPTDSSFYNPFLEFAWMLCMDQEELLFFQMVLPPLQVLMNNYLMMILRELKSILGIKMKV